MRIDVFEHDVLSLEHAQEAAPPDYIQAYQWFLDNEGYVGPRPFGKRRPENIAFPLCQQAGIMVPSRRKYAVSVTVANYGAYDDMCMSDLGDGTWIMRYCAHRQTTGTNATPNKYNAGLKHCLQDGLPVGVFLKDKHSSGYICMGLAFIECYDEATDVFVLHGPVNATTSSSVFCTTEERELELPDEDEDVFENDALNEPDNRPIHMALRVQRQRQDRFRDGLLSAYDRRCAITDCPVVETLQAAHITPYHGVSSQKTSNGLLLRADLHLLFDSFMLSINPEDCRVVLGDELRDSPYRRYDGAPLSLPRNRADRPAFERLACHYDDFKLRHSA